MPVVSNIQIYPIIVHLWIFFNPAKQPILGSLSGRDRLSRCWLLGLQLCCSLQHFIGAVLDGDSKKQHATRTSNFKTLIACHNSVSCLILGSKPHSRNCTYEISYIYRFFLIIGTKKRFMERLPFRCGCL